MTKIFKYFDPSLVIFLNSTTRDEVIQNMVDKLVPVVKLMDRKSFYEAIMDREKIVSTGIGMGVAIPHAKLPDYDHFFIAIGILHKGVEWHALDHAPVRLIFMIGGPDDKQTEYLQILSRLTVALKDEERRKKMLTLHSPEAVVELFNKF